MAKNYQDINEEERHKIQDAEIKETLRHIKHKVLVMSGKGGVGKSSIAACLAVLLAGRGFMVGLADERPTPSIHVVPGCS
jgi:Mrp family chromosome partitioning ATPase